MKQKNHIIGARYSAEDVIEDYEQDVVSDDHVYGSFREPLMILEAMKRQSSVFRTLVLNHSMWKQRFLRTVMTSSACDVRFVF